MSKKGKYSGSVRLDPSKMEEPDQDNEFSKKMWLEDVKKDPEFLDDVKEQVDKWKKSISITADPDELKIHMVGESHIDVAWKWRYEQTRQKAIKTFRKAVTNAKHFEGRDYNYCFALSEPLLLDWVLQDDPGLFKEIQETVKKGGIELVGGSYVEPDCMMPSGEAFARSRLYGQRFLKTHFNQLAEIEWFLDSFGYNLGLPQILVKSGATGFWTSKITWNRQTIFPFVNFWWQGPDGSKLLTANFQMGMGSIERWIMWEMGRHPLKSDGRKEWDYTKDYEEIDEHVVLDEICPHCGCFFGKGDGGHGPTFQEVAVANAWQDLGFAKWSRVGKFYDGLREWADRFPIWKDELYLEYHRGTFSVHSEVKRHNRLYENALTGLETFALLTGLANPNYKYPREKLERIWKIVLQNQFHDVLPGSSIPEVYDDVYDFWVEQDALIEDIKGEIGNTIGSSQEEKPLNREKVKTISLFNPVAWERESPVFIPIEEVDDSIQIDEEGKPPYIRLTLLNDTNKQYLAQPTAAEPEDNAYPRTAGWWVVPKLNGVSNTPAKVEILSEPPSDTASSLEVTEKSISNGAVSIKLDETTGAMTSMIAEGINSNKNLLKGKNSNLNFGFLDDYPHDHAWNIKPEYWKYPLEDIKNDKGVNIEVVEQGPIFSTIQISRLLGKENSPVRQVIRLFKNCPEVYLEWATDWKQPYVMIKILYSTATNAEVSTADAAYCAIIRKTQPETNCDKARYEKIMHKYVDLSTPDKSWGLALLNEGKYAYDTMGNRGDLRLTLLRVPKYPTASGEAWVNLERKMNREKYGQQVPEFSGMGAEKCRYALLPHVGGTLTNSDGSPNALVKRKAEEFNQPVMVVSSNAIREKKENLDINSKSIIDISPSNIFLGALKRNEWDLSDNIILRVVEGCGVDTNATIRLAPELNKIVKQVREVDLLERPIDSELQWDKEKGILTKKIGKFEIVTYEFVI
ncbi:MAG: hypothetical protein GF364_10895 [Candidatus Lokiarchaeota archaeon]|nr:hypothetical protein [Candidatus Lokiarchaeota archaeon]